MAARRNKDKMVNPYQKLAFIVMIRGGIYGVTFTISTWHTVGIRTYTNTINFFSLPGNPKFALKLIVTLLLAQ